MRIDEAYIRDINSKIDTYRWISDVTADSYIDVKDSVQNWWVTKAIQIDEIKEEINLHFDGWVTKYDETIPFASTRMEPFRMITKGYTGMKSTSKRDEWKYTFHDLDALK